MEESVSLPFQVHLFGQNPEDNLYQKPNHFIAINQGPDFGFLNVKRFPEYTTWIIINPLKSSNSCLNEIWNFHYRGEQSNNILLKPRYCYKVNIKPEEQERLLVGVSKTLR